MSATTITFGDVAENGIGMEKIGALADDGFTYLDLARAKWRFEAAGCKCELIDLISDGRIELLGDDIESATVLVVRNAIPALIIGADADDTAAEQCGLAAAGMPPDRKAIFRGEVKNKRARHNLCFAPVSQEPNYTAGRGRIVSFNMVPCLAAIRDALPVYFGPKGANLLAEGNYYYDVSKCGIGFHGDAERRKVIAFRFGAAIPLHYQWYLRWQAVGSRIAIALNHGDMYAMSTKAVGSDWRSSSKLTLRHAAGAAKYLQ
jgi:hypothetical protein